MATSTALAKQETALVRKEQSLLARAQRAKNAETAAKMKKFVADKMAKASEVVEKSLEWQHTGNVIAPLSQFTGTLAESMVNKKLGKGWGQAAGLIGAAVEGVGIVASIMTKKPKLASIFTMMAAFGNGMRQRLTLGGTDAIANSIFGP